MTYIYFDESGDLGFDFSKSGTSNWFLIAFLITKNNTSRQWSGFVVVKGRCNHLVGSNRSLVVVVANASKCKASGDNAHTWYDKISSRFDIMF